MRYVIDKDQFLDPKFYLSSNFRFKGDSKKDIENLEIVTNIINHYFNISYRPIYLSSIKLKNFDQEVRLYVFVYCSRKVDFSYYAKGKNMFRLTNLLSEFFNKSTNIKLIKLRSPFLDAQILAKYFSAKTLQKNNLPLVRKLFLKAHTGLRSYYDVSKYLNVTYNDDFYLKFIKFKFLNGLKMNISGRTSKRRVNGKTRFYSKSLGRFNNFSYITKGQSSKISVNGLYNIKIKTAAN
jgi:hypothetical protein